MRLTSLVQQPHTAAINNLSVMVDSDQIRCSEGGPSDSEGIHPERSRFNRVLENIRDLVEDNLKGTTKTHPDSDMSSNTAQDQYEMTQE